MSVAKQIQEILEKASWIRRMFEEGAALKAQHGPEKVFDFSLGNPNLPPPARFRDALVSAAAASQPNDHAYMPNVGYTSVRQAVARIVSRDQEVPVTAEEIIMTCGAAGALNVILKAILDPGDEVITPAPYFVEYGFYVGNHGGVLRPVSTLGDFGLDVNAIRAAVTAKTKAVLLNSPNNPTGQVYPAESLRDLAAMLETEAKRLGHAIYLISDEPYRKIVFDGTAVAPLFPIYPDSIVATSHSKDLSIPGERIGYLAVSPRATDRGKLLAGMALANRILGFVNAPAFMQRVIATLQGVTVDPAAYQAKRDLLCDGLSRAGYEFVKPKGAFYLFPKTPTSDDVAFVRALQEELILTVPGRGFGTPGYFRIAYCVEDATIENALPGFARVMERFAGSPRPGLA